ncbi:hypothetical protein ABZP36_035975 [Zizania latifolia]
MRFFLAQQQEKLADKLVQCPVRRQGAGSDCTVSCVSVAAGKVLYMKPQQQCSTQDHIDVRVGAGTREPAGSNCDATFPAAAAAHAYMHARAPAPVTTPAH